MLSDGRLEVGLGAGWKRWTTSARASRWTLPKVRVERMIEHTQVLQGLFADGPFSFSR